MLALQINNQWAVLSEDQSVTIEENSPVWGEGNTFSLPFELDVEANRHILGNSDQLTGMSVYDVLEGLSATLYVMGIPLFYGKLSLEDEVEIADGKVEVSLISSTLAFNEMIEGMNCQDVELTEEIVVGERWSEYSIKMTDSSTSKVVGEINGAFPSLFMRMKDGNKSTINLSAPYPDAAYCNTRICYSLPEDLQDNEKGPENRVNYYVDVNSGQKIQNEPISKVIDSVVKGKYVVLDAERPLSAPCFYVLYFLKCLFVKLGISFDNKFSTITAQEEDMARLAFMQTACNYTEKDTSQTDYIIIPRSKDRFAGWPMVNGSVDYPLSFWRYQGDSYLSQVNPQVLVHIPVKKCVATSENFPNVDVSDIIEAMQNGFGIRFLFNKKQTEVTPVYVRDVLNRAEVKSLNAEVLDIYKQESAVRGFVLKYSGNDEDTSFNYNEWNNYVTTDSFNYVQKSVTDNNKKLYIDSRNGNAYRIKNDGEVTDEDKQKPALFEVAMFSPVKYGDCSDENRVEEIAIPFSPVVVNDTAVAARLDKLAAQRIGNSEEEIEKLDESNNEQRFAPLLDVEMKYPSLRPARKIGGYATFENGGKRVSYEVSFTYVDTQRYDEKYTDQSLRKIKENRKEHRSKFGTPTPQKYLDNDSPIQTFDAGLTLGIMRGPGNTAGVQDYDEGYDGEGNFKYVTVPTNYAFHSDTVDNYGRVFDYDGEGNYTGVDTSRRFSLKLRAEKPTPEGAKKDVPVWPDDYHNISESYARRRGLFDKFYTEYAYFVTHRKIAKLTLRMEIADLVNIDWTKRYRIDSFIGFINSYSYTVDSQGISEVQMELYYI